MGNIALSWQLHKSAPGVHSLETLRPLGAELAYHHQWRFFLTEPEGHRYSAAAQESPGLGAVGSAVPAGLLGTVSVLPMAVVGAALAIVPAALIARWPFTRVHAS